MGCKKQLFREERDYIGVVPDSSVSEATHTTEVVVTNGRSGQGGVSLPEAGGIAEAATSSWQGGSRRDVVAGMSEAGTSSSRCMLSPSVTLTASEMATPDPEKKYTHDEDIDPGLIPRPGMTFRNREEARAFYKEYARKVGFGLCYKNSKPY